MSQVRWGSAARGHSSFHFCKGVVMPTLPGRCDREQPAPCSVLGTPLLVELLNAGLGDRRSTERSSRASHVVT